MMKRLVWILIFVMVASFAYCEEGKEEIIVKDWSSVGEVNELAEIVNNEIESGYYELLRYKESGLLIIDFQSKEDQNMALSRISIFVEDGEKKGKIVDEEYAREKDENFLAHDLKGEDIAEFFNLVKEEGKELNDLEKEILELVISNDMIREEEGEYISYAYSALISIHHQKGLEAYRGTIVSHELQHGLDFTNPKHWKESKAGWNSLSSREKKAFKRFLSGAGVYDTSNEELAITEFRAFTSTTGDVTYEDYLNYHMEKENINKEEADMLKEFSMRRGFWEEKHQTYFDKTYVIFVVTVLFLIILINLIRDRKNKK